MSGLKIVRNFSLKNYTTFKIGGVAKYFFIAKSVNQLISIVRWATKNKKKYFILGGGSNILLSDQGFKGLVIKMELNKIEPKVISPKKLCLIVDAGVPLFRLVRLSCQQALTGLEWAAGIPGTLGGAIRGNAGAFDQSISGSVKRVKVLDKNLKIKYLSQRQCGFSYRQSSFKESDLIILSAEIILSRGHKKEIQSQVNSFLQKRSSQPHQPSAGCIFQNIPFRHRHQILLKKYSDLVGVVKNGLIPAAWLIDRAGLKGLRFGQAQISPEHANFIVNLGGAKSKEVMKALNTIHKIIKNKFSIELKREIEIL